jgi:predicted aminopeptidase
LVGSFPFLGWFDRESALDFAAELKREGWDVDVRGASAYSTLGWFRDSILSTMLREGPEAMGELVHVVIHESVHATLYLKGQSHFNESLADFVADQLVSPYLRKQGYADEDKAFSEGRVKFAKQRKRLHEAYDRLRAIYGSSRSSEENLAEKEREFASLKEELQIKRELSNASLVQFRTYDVGGAEFAALLGRCGGDWSRFWGALRALDSASFGASEQEAIGPVLDQISCR